MSNTEASVREIFTRLENVEKKTDNAPIGYNYVETTYQEPGTWVYYADFVISLGESATRPGDTVYLTKLWANGDVIYDQATGYRKPGLKFKFYTGAENQGEVWHGMHYRGLMVVRFLRLALTDYGNTIPTITAELADGPSVAISVVGQLPAFDGGVAAGFKIVGDRIGKLSSPFTNIGGSFAPGKVQLVDIYSGEVAVSSMIEPLFRSKFRLKFPADSAAIAWAGDSGESTVALGYADGTEWAPYAGVALFNTVTGVQTGLVDEVVAPGSSEYGLTEFQGVVGFTYNPAMTSRNFVLGAGYNSDKGYVEYSLLSLASGISLQWNNASDIHGGETDLVAVLLGRNDPMHIYPAELYGCTKKNVTKLMVFSPSTTQFNAVAVVVDEDFFTASAGEEIVRAYFDAARQRLMVVTQAGDDAFIHELDGNGSGVLWRSEAFPAPAPKSSLVVTDEATANLTEGTLGIAPHHNNPSMATLVDLEMQTIQTVQLAKPIPAGAHALWDSRTLRLHLGDFSYIEFGRTPDLNDENRHTVDDVLRAYARHVGYTDAEVSTTNLDMPLYGYVASNQEPITQVINNIAPLYGVNWFERNDTLTFKSVYAPNGDLIIDGEIAPGTLALLSESEDVTDTVTVVRDPDTSLPARLSLSYFDINNDYLGGLVETGRLTGPRASSDAKTEPEFTIPMVIDGAYAEHLLRGMLNRIWAARVSVNVRTPTDYFVFDPGDTITVTAEGYEYTLGVQQTRLNADFSVSIVGSELAGVNFPAVITPQPPRVRPGPAGMARFAVFDVPDINPNFVAQEYLNLIVVASGTNRDLFTGTVIERQADNREWQPLTDFTPDEQGYLGALISAPDMWRDTSTLDTVNSVYVDSTAIPDSMFVAATDVDLDAGKNLIVVGNSQVAEYIQFKDAVKVNATTWRLFNLRRGRYGTDTLTGKLPLAGWVAFMINYKVVTYRPSDMRNGAVFAYRSRSPKQVEGVIPRFELLPTGNSRKPYAPVNITAEIDFNGDIVVRWTRRARFYNNPPTAYEPSPPLDEHFGAPYERYAIYIYDGDHFTGERSRQVVNQTEWEFSRFDRENLGLFLEDGVLYLRIHQLNATHQLEGFAYDSIIPVLPADAVKLGVVFDGEGELELGIVEPAPTLSVVFDGGGELTVEVETPPAAVTLSVVYDGGGNLDIEIPDYVTLGATFEGGGELDVGVAVRADLSVTFDGGGILVCDVESGHPFKVSFDGEGALDIALRVSQALGADFAGEGALDIAVRVPALLALDFAGEGSLSVGIQSPASLAVDFAGGGDLVADVALPVKVVSVSFDAGGALAVAIASNSEDDTLLMDTLDELVTNNNLLTEDGDLIEFEG